MCRDLPKKKPAPNELPMLPKLVTILQAHKARMERLECEVTNRVTPIAFATPSAICFGSLASMK